MFHPMAFTVVMALLGAHAAVASPSCRRRWRCSWTRSMARREGRLMHGRANAHYAPLPGLGDGRTRPVVFTAAGLVVVALSGSAGHPPGHRVRPQSGRRRLRGARRCAFPAPAWAQSVQDAAANRKDFAGTSSPRSTNVFARTGTAEIASTRCRPASRTATSC